jgi:hypothetical protein
VDQKAQRLTTDIADLYGNSTIGQVGTGRFTNASASVPLVSKSAPSHFVVSKMAVTSAPAPHPPTVQASAPITTPPVAQKVAAPQAVASAPAHEASGEYLKCLHLQLFTLSIAAPKQATNAPAPAAQYNEWTANVVMEVSTQSI